MRKGRLSVTVDVVSLWRLLLCLIVIINFRVIVIFIFGLQGDCPAGREDGMMDVQLVCFEKEAAKHSGHGEGLAIGKVDQFWCHTSSMTAGTSEYFPVLWKLECSKFLS